MKKTTNDTEVLKALLNNNTTAGKLSAVLGIADQRFTRLSTLEAAVEERDETIKELRGLLQEIYDEGHGQKLRGDMNALLVKTAPKVQSEEIGK